MKRSISKQHSLPCLSWKVRNLKVFETVIFSPNFVLQVAGNQAKKIHFMASSLNSHKQPLTLNINWNPPITEWFKLNNGFGLIAAKGINKGSSWLLGYGFLGLS